MDGLDSNVIKLGLPQGGDGGVADGEGDFSPLSRQAGARPKGEPFC